VRREAEEGNRYHLSVKELPLDERPRERLHRYGAGALTNAELLAVVLNTGTRGESVLALAQRLLVEYGGLAGLARVDAETLRREHGLGEAKAAKLKAALELGRRLAVAQPDERPAIRTPEDAYSVAGAEMGSLEQEYLRVLLLDAKNRVLRCVTVSQGSVSGAQVRVAEVFKDAIRHNAPALILLHNHPSGDPTPSGADIALTASVVQAGELLGIEVVDHLVIGQGRFQSLRRLGLGFPGNGSR
jgi:DNA repair protein RadC